MPVSSEPSLQLYWPIKLLSVEGLVLCPIPVLMRPFSELTPAVILWALLTLCPMLSSISLSKGTCRALASKGLGSGCSGFIMAYQRCISTMYLALCLIWEIITIKGWAVSWMPTHLSTLRKLMINVINKLVYKLNKNKTHAISAFNFSSQKCTLSHTHSYRYTPLNLVNKFE